MNEQVNYKSEPLSASINKLTAVSQLTAEDESEHRNPPPTENIHKGYIFSVTRTTLTHM